MPSRPITTTLPPISFRPPGHRVPGGASVTSGTAAAAARRPSRRRRASPPSPPPSVEVETRRQVRRFVAGDGRARRCRRTPSYGGWGGDTMGLPARVRCGQPRKTGRPGSTDSSAATPITCGSAAGQPKRRGSCADRRRRQQATQRGSMDAPPSNNAVLLKRPGLLTFRTLAPGTVTAPDASLHFCVALATASQRDLTETTADPQRAAPLNWARYHRPAGRPHVLISYRSRHLTLFYERRISR